MFCRLMFQSYRQLFARLPFVRTYRTVQCSGICPSGRRCTKRVKTDVTPAYCLDKHAHSEPRTVFFEGVDLEAELLRNIRLLGWEALEWYLHDSRTRLATAQMERVHISTSDGTPQ